MIQSYKYHNNRTLPVILTIILIITLPSCEYIIENGLFGRRSLKKALLWAKQDSIRVADSLKRTLVVTSDTFGVRSVTIDNSEEVIISGENTKNQFFIIIGSFANPENAKLAAGQYRSRGYNTSIIRTTNSYGNKVDMVSVRTFSNYEEATSYLKELQGEIDPGAWIYQDK
jgi:hypothetical protein